MIRPVSSATGMNWIGGIVPRVGWFQRTQRFDAEDLSAGEPDDRLVVQLELVQAERVLEIRSKLEPLDDPLVHRRLEDAVASLAVALGHVHRDVGVPQQLGRLGRLEILADQTDARRSHAGTTFLPSISIGSSRARGFARRRRPLRTSRPRRRAARRTRPPRSARPYRSAGRRSSACGRLPAAPRPRPRGRGCRSRS